MFNSLYAVIFYTKDIEESKKFYLETLGFTLVSDQGNYVAFKANVNDRTCLAVNMANTPEKVPGRQTVILKTENIEKIYQALLDKKATITKGLQEASWGKTFALADPDGNKIEVME